MATTKITTPELFDFSATNTALQLPAGDTASRPTSPSTGEWRYNTELKYVEYYDGADWFQIDTEAPANPDDFPSQNFNTSTYFGNSATQTLDAKFNEAANFNGSTSYIQTGFTLPADSTMSFSFWLKPIGYLSGDSYIWSDLNSAGSGVSRGLDFRFNSSGDFIVDIATTSNVLTYPMGASALGVWVNLVITIDGTAVILYKNGTSVATATSSSAFGTVGPRQVTLGRAGDYTPVAHYNGYMDQIRVFNTVLPATGTASVDTLYAETATTAATLDFPAGAGCIWGYQLDGNAADIGGTYGGVESNIGYTGLKFTPDFVWIKQRSSPARNHVLFDTVRGPATNLNILYSDLTNAQDTNVGNTFLSSISTNALNLGSSVYVNGSGEDYVAWNWEAGGAPTTTNSAGAGNVPTAGSVKIDGADSTTALAGTIAATKISANTAAGFSTVQYTGNGTNNATVAHGLSQAPELWIGKRFDPSGGPGPWQILFSGLPEGTFFQFDNSAKGFSSNVSFDPTTTTIKLQGGQNINNSGGINIGYGFHSVANYQKIGTYTGTNAPGNIISTELTVGDGGFEPALVMIKSTGATSGNWIVLDNKRNSVNPRTDVLKWDTDGNETTEAALDVTFATNGFVLNGAAGAAGTGQINSSGIDYIFLAIAADKDTSVPTLANSFETVLYTGNGGTQNISTSFAPDLVWVKDRDTAYQNNLYDSIRGATNAIESNGAVAEYSLSGLTSFNTNGFTLGSNAGNNQNGSPNVAWCWKAGGLPTINTDGDITTLVSANVAAGFSIVKYIGSSTLTDTIGHGLGTPDLIICKRTTGSSANWAVWSSSFSASSETLFLDLLVPSNLYINRFASVTSTTFQAGTNGGSEVNPSGSGMIAYCFKSISGYQKIGSYTWTGTSYTAGTMVTGLGFTPSFVMIKGTDVDSNWQMYDNKRVSGTQNYALYADSSDVESTSGYQGIKFDSNGFSAAAGADGNVTGSTSLNQNGKTYIYLAIA